MCAEVRGLFCDSEIERFRIDFLSLWPLAAMETRDWSGTEIGPADAGLGVADVFHWPLLRKHADEHNSLCRNSDGCALPRTYVLSTVGLLVLYFNQQLDSC